MKESFGAASNSLPAFQATGFFLDDLVLYSINQIEDKNERNEHRQKGVQSLAQRMCHRADVADAMREAGLRGEHYKRAHLGRLFRGLDSWEVRRVRSDVAADPNYRFRVDSEGADPHDSAPNPLAMFFGSNLVANCADYNGSAGSSGY